MPDKQKQAANNVVTIPQFLSEQEKAVLDNNSIRKNAGKLYKLMLGISSVWVLIVAIYITQFFGWSNLFLMMPDEFGGFLAGVTLPLAIIWMVIAYIDRGASFKQEAKLLHTYMNQLVYPEDGAAQTTKAMADAIREQVIELQEATKTATRETAKIKNELNQHVNDFSKLVEILQGYSGTTMTELNEGIRLMSQGLDYVNEKINGATSDIESRLEQFSATANTIHTDINSVTSNLNRQLGEVKEVSDHLHKMYGENSNIITMNNELVENCSSKLNNNFTAINDFVNNQNNRMEELSQKITENYKQMYKQLENKSIAVEEKFSGQIKQITEYMKGLDNTSLLTAERFETFRSNVNKEVDSIITKAQAIGDCVEIQVRNLSGVSDTIHQNIDNAQQKIVEFQDMSQQTITNLNAVSDSVSDKMSQLLQLNQNAIDSSKALCEELHGHNTTLASSLRETQTQSQQICDQIVAGLSASKETGQEFLEVLKNIDAQILQQTSGLQNASENLETQNRLNTASFDQQYKLLQTALSKIESSRVVLKQQMDEIIHLATTLDDETINSMKHMDTVLSDNLQKSQQIIMNNTSAAEQLQKQMESFDEMSKGAVAKVIEFSDAIYEKQTNMEESVQQIVNQSVTVSNTLEEQLKAVNEATIGTSNKHNKMLELFNQQSSILNNTAENTVKYVADVIQTLDEKAEMINLLFRNYQTEFFSICDRLSDNTGNIGNTLKNQITVLEQRSDRIFNRMSGIEEEFTKKAEMLSNVSNQTIDRLEEISSVLNNQNQDIEGSVSGISKKMQAVGDEVSKYLAQFTQNLQAVKNESSAAGNEINDNCRKLKELQRTILVETQNTNETIEKQVQSLDNSLTKINEQNGEITAGFYKQKETITDVVNLISTQIRLGEASLSQQYKYLSDATENISQKIQEVEKSFQTNVSGIFNNSTQLAYEINSLSDTLIKAGEDVKKTTKSSLTDIQSVGIALNNTAEELTSTVNASHKKVEGIIDIYQNNIANFTTVTAEASSGIVEANNLISHQNDKMIKISEDTRNLVNSFNVVLNEASNQLVKRANSAYEQIKEMSTQIKDLSLQLEDSTQLTAKHMDTAGNKMRANINEIAVNAERISNDIKTSGEVFLKQSDVLVHATGETISKVVQAMDALKNGSDNLSLKGKAWIEQSDEFAKIFERQAQIIDATSLKASENMRNLESKYREVQTDSFLNDAATIFEKMETIAIDINRIFNPTTEEEIWKKYYSGDNAVFIRHLAKVMTKNQIAAIRKEYEKNPDFRGLVNRYVSDFEMLISKAKGNERSGVLLSVISGSDVGKVYYIIAKALDKLN